MRTKSSYRFETISSLLATQAETHARACALRDPVGEQLNYKDLHRRVASICSQLGTFGLGRRSRIANVLPNGLNMSVMLLAVTSTSIAAPLDPAYREAEFQSYFTDIGVDCVIVPAGGGSSAARAVARKIDIPIVELASDGFTLVPRGTSPVSSAAAPIPRRRMAAGRYSRTISRSSCPRRVRPAVPREFR